MAEETAYVFAFNNSIGFLLKFETSRFQSQQFTGFSVEQLEHMRSDLIQKLVRVNIELNRRRSRFSILPREIALEIFAYTLADMTGDEDEARVKAYHWMWNLVHVCHSWRELLLDVPHLWSHIELSGNADHTKERIRLSKNRALYIKMSGPKIDKFYETWDPTQTWGKEIDVVIGHLSRISYFDLGPGVIASPSPPHDALHLKAISIRSSLYYNYFHGADIVDYISKCGLPVLESLSVSGLLYNRLDVIFKPWLRHLVLSYVSWVPESSIGSAEKILGLLNSLPLLESLEVSHFLSAHQLHDFHVEVKLPNLTSLGISDTAIGCQTFLDHLSISHSTSTSIYVTAFDNVNELQGLFTLIKNGGFYSQQNHNEEYPTFRSAYLGHHVTRSSHFRSWTSSLLSRKISQTPYPPSLDLQVCYNDELEDIGLLNIVDIIHNPETLESLSVRREGDVLETTPTNWWKRLFLNSPALCDVLITKSFYSDSGEGKVTKDIRGALDPHDKDEMSFCALRDLLLSDSERGMWWR